MLERILARLRRLLRDDKYVVTLHALEAMHDDGLTIFDVERCLSVGSIVMRQWDRGRREWKYLVKGQAAEDTAMVVVCKIGRSGRLVIVTVYILEGESQ